MAERTMEEAKEENVAKMGNELGTLYTALWQALAGINIYWSEYKEMFGTKPERIDLLNRAAPAFFRMLQDELWDMALLHIARITDPAQSFGQRDKSNLTVQALPALIADPTLRANVTVLIAEAINQTEFCRDWRNRRIAHRDLKLALDQPTTPLASASRLQVNKALEALGAILNAMAAHYFDSETLFHNGVRIDGAVHLMYLLDDGLRAQEERTKRLASGKPLEADFKRRAL